MATIHERDILFLRWVASLQPVEGFTYDENGVQRLLVNTTDCAELADRLEGLLRAVTRADLTFLRDAAADLRKFDVPGWPLYAEQFASLAERIAAHLAPEDAHG